ncbi:MAG: hypothetical protein MRY74_11020 [Neomegalonema sp.]|nr:hypothetical protein [Neomegalonema sp.]
MSGALFGLLGGALIGLSDALVRVTGRRLPVFLLITAVFGLSLAPVSLYMLLTGAWPAFEAWSWSIAVASGLANTVGLALLFVAIARGPIVVVSPIFTSSTVMIVGLNVLAGEPFRLAHGVAIIVTLAAILALAWPEDRRAVGGERENASELAITAAIAFCGALAIALRMFLAQEATEGVGALGATVLSRSVSALCGAVGYVVWRWAGGAFTPAHDSGPRVSLRFVWLLVLAQSLLETTSIFLVLLGGDGDDGDRVGSIIGFAAYAAFSPIAARIMWADRIGWRRGACIALAIAGAAIAAAA